LISDGDFLDICAISLVDRTWRNEEEFIVVEQDDQAMVSYLEDVVDESFSESKICGQNVHIWELEKSDLVVFV
jgi:hypothetical protein